MRVYSSTCQDFIRDVGTGQIAAIVERAYTRAYGHSTSESEIRSWKNSLAALSNILDHGDVPSDLGLGIEFQIPKPRRESTCCYLVPQPWMNHLSSLLS